MMSTARPRVIMVTGANRGIGLAIVQALATDPVTRDTNFLLACRDNRKGDEAVVQLRQIGVTCPLQVLPLDVTSDTSMRKAVSIILEQYGHLDVLINNHGYAAIPTASDFSDHREIYSTIYDVNVTSVALLMQLFLPLLRNSEYGGKIINVSSARGSIGRSAAGLLPPSVAVPYGISKAALNALTVEFSRMEENKDVEFQLVSPGHCKTAFNGYRGTRDPLEGANVVVQLVRSPKGKLRNAGFWETIEDHTELVEIPW